MAANKRASLRGRGADIFFGGKESETDELANFSTDEVEEQPAPPPTTRRSRSAQEAPAEPPRRARTEPEAPAEPARRSRSEERDAASNLPTLPAYNSASSRVSNSVRIREEELAPYSVNGRPVERQPRASYPRQTQPPAYVEEYEEAVGAGLVRPADEQPVPVSNNAFSSFYREQMGHYLLLEPLATRMTTEQMDHLSSLERRIHQGRRRKQPRITKNSILRALLEATFDLDLDTREINSELELVNRIREALGRKRL